MTATTPARKGDWMQTYSGRQFWPLDPRPEEIFIEDIAHSLANQCRFAGHCREFYSVAQHSVIVARLVPPEFQRWALLHDASEAYLVDLPRPVKRFSKLGDEYRQVEDRLMLTIAYRFGLTRNWEQSIDGTTRIVADPPQAVHEADDIVLMTEKRDVMGHHQHLPKWRGTAQPMPRRIKPVSPEDAETMFIAFARNLNLLP